MPEQFPWRMLSVTAFLSIAATGLFLARAPILQIPASEFSGADDGSTTQADCPTSTPVTFACESINP